MSKRTTCRRPKATPSATKGDNQESKKSPLKSNGPSFKKIPLASCHMEISLGNTQTHFIEIIRHVRRTDLKWWASNLEAHNEDLMKILSDQIFPLSHVAGDIIKGYWDDIMSRVPLQTNSSNKANTSIAAEGNKKGSKKKRKKSPDLLDGESASNVLVSSISNSMEYAANSSGLNINGGGNKGKCGDSEKKSKLTHVPTNNALGDDRIALAFGDIIQVAYSVEDVETKGGSATLLFEEPQNKSDDFKATIPKNAHILTKKEKSTEENQVKFRGNLYKIPRKIIVWCYRLSEDDATRPCPEHNFDEMVDGENIENGFLRKKYMPST